MKKDGLAKLYNRLTPDERFKLTIEAMSRGDEEETGRLTDSCPRKSYRMGELAFTARFKGSMTLTIGFCLDLAPLLANLTMIEGLREVLLLTYNVCEDGAILAYLEGREAGSKHAWEAAGERGNPPGWREGGSEGDDNPVVQEALQKTTSHLKEVREVFVRSLQELERDVASEALTIWEAFASFCNGELSVEPEKLLKAFFEPILPQVEKLKNLPDPPGVDPDALKEYEQALQRVWDLT